MILGRLLGVSTVGGALILSTACGASHTASSAASPGFRATLSPEAYWAVSIARHGNATVAMTGGPDTSQPRIQAQILEQQITKLGALG